MKEDKLEQLKKDFTQLTRSIYGKTYSISLSDARELLIEMRTIEDTIQDLINESNNT